MYTFIVIPKKRQLSWFRYETFITFLTFRLSTRGERERERERERKRKSESERIFTLLTVRPASALNSLTLPTRVHPAADNWTSLAQLRNPSRFV